MKSRTTVLLLAAVLCASVRAADKDPQCGGVSGNPELAIKVCTRLIEFGSLPRRDLAQAYFVRGAEWVNQGNHDRAIADFSMALELEPKLPGAHLNRALSWSEKGDSERAIADYTAALQLSPKDVRAHMGRAVEWTVKGDYKRAVADYEDIIRLEPQGMAGYFGRGRARFYADDFMSAASDFLRAHQLEGSVYTALWVFLARKRADIPGEKTLAQDAGMSEAGEWPAPLVGLYLGSASPEAVLKAAGHQNPARQREQRCEANFYLAHWHLLRGARAEAVPFLQEARRQCPSGFIEHEGAVAELRRLERKP